MGALDGFRTELDPHLSGHEVVLRAGEVRAYFRNGVGSWKTEQRSAGAHPWPESLSWTLLPQVRRPALLSAPGKIYPCPEAEEEACGLTDLLLASCSG